jgi:DNA-binding NtrC family response regulator
MANAIAQLLAASPTPFYAVDEQRRIVFCNPACGELVGCAPQELVGRRCDYRPVGESHQVEDVAASLCPPPEAFSGYRSQADVTVIHRRGEVVARRGEYLPLGSDPLTCVGVVAALYDPSSSSATGILDGAEARQLHQRLVRLRQGMSQDLLLDELIGESAVMRRVRDQVQLALRGPANTVICGPVGIDRERVARVIHYRNQPEKAGPLVPLFCAVLDAEIIQSTIKSMVQQMSQMPGGGIPCLLLSEVDQLRPDAQAELAGFMSLPDFELYAVTTAQQPLTRLAEDGLFLPELACALSTLVIQLPPLAVRPQDVPLLCQHHLEKFNAQGEKQLSGFSSEALDELCGYPWPDNIEELSEVVEEACHKADGPYVLPADLGDRIRGAAAAVAHPRRHDEPVDLDQFLADIERELMSRAMSRAKGNKTKAAALLNISRARLLRRLQQLGLES